LLEDGPHSLNNDWTIISVFLQAELKEQHLNEIDALVKKANAGKPEQLHGQEDAIQASRLVDRRLLCLEHLDFY